MLVNGEARRHETRTRICAEEDAYRVDVTDAMKRSKKWNGSE